VRARRPPPPFFFPSSFPLPSAFSPTPSSKFIALLPCVRPLGHRIQRIQPRIHRIMSRRRRIQRIVACLDISSTFLVEWS
jgi:hypothetical protein